MVPLKIQTKESASLPELKNNVLTNLDILTDWLGTRYTVHDREAVLVSFGKSFRDDPKGAIEKVLKTVKDPSKVDIFTVKHCLPLFKDLPVKPRYCVCLDPREVMGTSTLGYKRASLFENVYPNDTTFLIASMTHPSVTQFVLGMGGKVIGWHSACEAMKDPQVGNAIKTWITGGSCSAMRAVSIMKVMGYRTIHLLGVDAVVEPPAEFVEKEKAKLSAFLDSAKFEFKNDDMRETFINTVAPALEIYNSKKSMATMGQDGTLMSIVEQIKDATGKTTHMKILIGNSILWGTPELIAIAQDLENMFKGNTDVTFKNHSGGICGALWDILGGEAGINPAVYPF